MLLIMSRSNSILVLIWDPVLRRELLAGLRSVRIRWILVLYLAIPFLEVLALWPTDQLYYGGSSRSMEVWKGFLISQGVLIALLTPIFSAYSVSAEFEQDTAEMLWNTTLSSSRIVFGKMMAIVFLCVALMLVAAPALSLIFFLGGVGLEEIGEGYAFLLLLTSSITAVGTFFSSWLRKGHLSLFFSYLVVSMVGGAVYLSDGDILPLFNVLLGMCLAIMILAWFRRLTGSVVVWLALLLIIGPSISIFINPPSAFTMGESLLFLLSSLLSGSGTTWGFLAFSTLFFGWRACRLGRRMVGEKARPNFKPVDDPGVLDRRRRTWPYYLVDPLRRQPPIADGANVVAEHEQRVHPLHRTVWGYRFLYPLPALAIPCALIPAFEYAEYYSVDNPFQWIIWWVCLAGMAPWLVMVHSISMTMERGMRTFDALRLAGITPLRFLHGKWLNSMRKRWKIMLVGVAAIILVNLLARASPESTVWAAVSWWLCVESLGLMVFAVSGLCSNIMFAIAGSVAMMVIMPFVFLLIGQISVGGLRIIDDFFFWVFSGFASWQYYGESLANHSDTIFAAQTGAWILAGLVWWWIAFRGLSNQWEQEGRTA
jgi:hypothetical protein